MITRNIMIMIEKLTSSESILTYSKNVACVQEVPTLVPV